ncbi:MAG: hypothetical protein LBL73_03940, partial [Synergistaceae bacterium]|nr:hypothetical protein [Synergistaceae bacterium]
MGKCRVIFWVLLLVALFSFMAASGGCGGSGGDENASVRLEDDYYAYVNADWLAKTEIPPDKGRVAVFNEIQDEIAKTLTGDLENLAVKSSEDPVTDMAAQYYMMFLDSGARNSTGFTPASADFARIENIKNMEDISSQASSLIMDGIPYEGGKINGSLTLGENTADAGGLSVALEAAKAIPDASLPDFFRQWATIRRLKIRPEFALRLLTEDVHSPGKLRVNVQLSSSDGFYDAYEIKEADGMYL